MKNKLILVAGCSGSGKSTIAHTILENFNDCSAQIICLDRFYKKSKELMPIANSSGRPNYDHPDAFDWPLLKKSLKALLNGKTCVLPKYNYLVQRREVNGDKFKPTDIIILEGTLTMFDKEILDMASLKVFVDTPLDECLIRRLLRDQDERGRSIKSIIKQWKEAVRPMYLTYVDPSKHHADLILPWEKININGLEFLTTAIKTTFEKK